MSVEATFKVKLLSFSDKVATVSKKLETKYLLECKDNCGWNEFVSWKKFTDKENQYVRGDTAFFEVSIKIGAWKRMWEPDDSLKENSSPAAKFDRND